MVNILSDAYSVLWADLSFTKRRWHRTLIVSLVGPILYLIAFGYGLGRGIDVQGSSYLEFVIPGIIALTAMTSSFNGAGTKLNVSRRFYKTFDEFLMSPISHVSLIIGKSLIGVIRGLISAIAFLIIAFLLSSNITVSPLFILTLIVSCFTFAFLGVLAALLANSYEDMGNFTAFVILPMTFLGGTFFSLSGLPQALKIVFYLLPLTHSSMCLRAEALGQPFPWISLVVLTCFGLAFFLGCLRSIKKASI
jgi:ABC-type multidrug transport system permease subunit